MLMLREVKEYIINSILKSKISVNDKFGLLAKKSSFLYTGSMEITRRELNKRNCRKRILRASRKLFSTKGYEETMIEDIAKRAEVSKATVYNYFPNKESLLTGTAEEVIERVRSLARHDLGAYENSEQKLRRVLQECVQASVEYLGLSRRITYLNSCADSALYQTHCGMTALFHELIEAAQAEGIFRADADVGDITDSVMGVYLLAQFQWAGVAECTADDLCEKVGRTLDRALCAYYA